MHEIKSGLLVCRACVESWMAGHLCGRQRVIGDSTGLQAIVGYLKAICGNIGTPMTDRLAQEALLGLICPDNSPTTENVSTEANVWWCKGIATGAAIISHSCHNIQYSQCHHIWNNLHSKCCITQKFTSLHFPYFTEDYRLVKHFSNWKFPPSQFHVKNLWNSEIFLQWKYQKKQNKNESKCPPDQWSFPVIH